MKYPCSEFPEVGKMLEDIDIKAIDSYGLDHGVWSILKHMYPKSDIPVVALSLNMAQLTDYHYKLGKKLKFLRENGILVLESGNIVHNLYLVDMYSDSDPYTWNDR